MKTNTQGDESNRSRYWVSGEARTESGTVTKKEEAEKKGPTGK